MVFCCWNALVVDLRDQEWGEDGLNSEAVIGNLLKWVLLFYYLLAMNDCIDVDE